MKSKCLQKTMNLSLSFVFFLFFFSNLLNIQLLMKSWMNHERIYMKLEIALVKNKMQESC